MFVQKVTIMGTAAQGTNSVSAMDMVMRLVSGSVLSRQEIVDEMVHRYPNLLPDELVAHVEAAMKRKLAAESMWPGITDVDRLNAAFQALNAGGLIALQSPAESSEMCELAAIAEWNRIGGADSGRIGFVFYHLKDVEDAVAYGELPIGYACFEQHPSLHDLPLMQEMIGHRVKETLLRHGLTVEWSGSTNEKIIVRLSWLKRGVAAPCERNSAAPALAPDDWELLCERTADVIEGNIR